MTKKNIIEKYLSAKAPVHDYGNLLACELPPGEIVPLCESLYNRHHLPLKTIAAFDEREATGFFKIMYVFGLPKENFFLAPFIYVGGNFPSLTSSIHEASTYERKIMTFFGLNPEGHPDPRPLILHENWPDNAFPLRKDFPWNERPETASGQFRFRKISGEGISEIPVGPVHAGIIEPGHFRFSVAGEEILLLEPRLGYSHKGSEKLFEKDTGVLAYRTAMDHGVTGVAGKAAGFAADARADYPYAAYDKLTFDTATEKSGDVYARYYVRVKEVYSSIALIKQALENLPHTEGSGAPLTPEFKKNYYAISIVEGWRGDIVCLVATDHEGNISRVDVRDPSFLNWTVLAHAGRGNMAPDFPLINKSFNLSYSGNDL